MVSKLVSTPDSHRLIAQEEYGHWRWHCFDLADGTHHVDWLAPWESDRGDLAIDPAGGRVALARRGEVRVLDLVVVGCGPSR